MSDSELKGILKAHQIRPQGKSWSADMYLLQAENKRLDAALAEIQHTPHLSSVEYNQMAAKARVK